MIWNIPILKKISSGAILLYCLIVVENFSYFFSSDISSALLSFPNSANSYIRMKNLHMPFKYLLMPDTRICESSPIILATVLSKPEHFELRKTIRNTWASAASSKFVKNKKVVVSFILSKPKDPNIVQDILKESQYYGDVILTDLDDSYDNLIFKVYSALSFQQQFCPAAQFLLKVDDDVIVDIDRMMKHIKINNASKKAIHGKIWTKAKPKRDPDNKWYIPEYMWPYQLFPKYCNGPFYLIGSEAVPKLLESATEVEKFKLEDVYFTGIVAEIARVPRIWWSKHILHEDGELWWGVSECDPQNESMIFSVHSLNSTEVFRKGLLAMKKLKCIPSEEVVKRRKQAAAKFRQKNL